MCTICKKEIDLNGQSKLVFKNPVMKSGFLLEVFPVLNLAKLDRKEYYKQIYLNTVKILSRKTGKSKKISKDTKRYDYYYGISKKEVVTYDERILNIRNFRYNNLEFAFTYIIAQMLYESFEDEPFIVNLNSMEEIKIKKAKYYILKSYNNVSDFVLDYLLCNKNNIQRKILKATGKTLETVEMELDYKK